eukprot:TRINITY_DN4603_c0_g1_i2.p1 TRINITY_DN4603_c0_g1~~TRINITY_DN4603_c0_g1_i2.p1  ORF type:complete len:567 (+),score=154.47 TRINITY_DN4603_c0_g1_i2:137-1837(+)
MAVPCPLLITSDQIGALYDAILVDNEHEDGTLTPQGSALIQTIVYALWQESAEEIVTTKSDFTTKEDVIAWYVDEGTPELLASPKSESPVPRLSLSLSEPAPDVHVDQSLSPPSGSEHSLLQQVGAALEAAENQISGLENELRNLLVTHESEAEIRAHLTLQLQHAEQAKAEADSTLLEREDDDITLHDDQQDALEVQRKQISQLDLEKADLESQKADLESQKADLESQKADLESQNADLESQKSDLESQKSDLESQNSNLESQKSDLESQNSNLESQKSDLESQKSDLESQKSDLESQNSNLESQKSDLETQLTELACVGSRLPCQQLNANVQAEDHQAATKSIKPSGGTTVQEAAASTATEAAQEPAVEAAAVVLEDPLESAPEKSAAELSAAHESTTRKPVRSKEPAANKSTKPAAGSKMKQPSSMLRAPNSTPRKPLISPRSKPAAACRPATKSTAPKVPVASRPRPPARTRAGPAAAATAASSAKVSPRPPRVVPRAGSGTNVGKASYKSPRSAGTKRSVSSKPVTKEEGAPAGGSKLTKLKKPVARSGFGFGGTTPRLGG